jgi:hypothetical protein
MALSGREVLMIIRAKDLASREIAQIGAAFGTLEGQAQRAAAAQIQQGSALLTVGAAMGIAGAAALTFYGNSLKAAVEYNKEVAYTATQVENGGQKLKEIGQIGIDVASKIPAPFKELQASLYDIFSSTNANLEQAEVLLEAFAKGAVAGMTDIQTAGRATISIMNAFKIPFEDVNHVMDVQFETVRLGVITYEQLATTIGRAIPSAVRAGQSIEDLAGMIAFLTRNGLSAAMAATSAARALDLLSNPKFAANMHDFGIEVTNAEGAFRPMVDVVDDLKKKFGELAPAQRTLEFLRLGGEGSAEALKELGIQAYDATGKVRPFDEVSKELTKTFKGMSEAEVSEALAKITKGAGGTIQAMRFLNLAVGDSNGLLRQLTEAIEGSSGAAEKAYQIMRNTPSMQVQLLSNQWQILKKEIGDGLIPAFSQLIGKLNDVLHWFLNLDTKTKDLIAKMGLFVAATMTLAGILTAVAGAVLILHGMFLLIGGSIVPIIAAVGGFTALAAAIVYLVTKTDLLEKAFKTAKNAVDAFMGGFQNPDAINNANSRMIDFGAKTRRVFDDLKNAWDAFMGGFQNPDAINNSTSRMIDFGAKTRRVFDDILSGAKTAFEGVKDAWTTVTGYIINSIQEEGFVGAFTKWRNALWQWIQDAVPQALSAANEFAQSILDWITAQTPGFIRQLYDWGVAFVDWLRDATPKAIAKLDEFLVAILDWITQNIQGFEDELAQWAVKLVEWIAVAIPLATVKLIEFKAKILEFFITDLLPAVVKALLDVGAAAAEAFARGLVGIPIALGKAFLEPLTNALTQQSEFVNQTSLNMGSFQRILHETGAAAEVDLDIIRFGGQAVIDKFKEIANQSPQMAAQIIAALKRAGIDTQIYEQILRDVQREHDKIGSSAEDAMRKAQNAANQYRSDLNLLLGSVNGVQSATAQFDLAVASLSRQIDSNATSTESNTVKQALLQQQFDRVLQSALNVIAQVKEHGIQTDADRVKVEAALAAMQAMADANPGQAAALQLVISKLQELANTPEVHKTNTIETQYFETHHVSQVNDTTKGTAGDPDSGPAEKKGGIIGFITALAHGGLVAAAAGRIMGFKTDGPTLVGEGNPIYPEYVIATDPMYRKRNVELFKQAGEALGLFNGTGAQMGDILGMALHDPKLQSAMAEGMQGAVGQIRGAFSQVQGALGGFKGVPGYVPSAEQVLMALSDTGDILAGLGGLPGKLTPNASNYTGPGSGPPAPKNMTIESGAIVIYAGSQDAKVIGMSVEDALMNFLRTLQSQ